MTPLPLPPLPIVAPRLKTSHRLPLLATLPSRLKWDSAEVSWDTLTRTQLAQICRRPAQGQGMTSSTHTRTTLKTTQLTQVSATSTMPVGRQALPLAQHVHRQALTIMLTHESARALMATRQHIVLEVTSLSWLLGVQEITRMTRLATRLLRHPVRLGTLRGSPTLKTTSRLLYLKVTHLMAITMNAWIPRCEGAQGLIA